MKSLKSVVSFGNIRMAFAFLIIGMGITIFAASYTGKNAEALAKSEYVSVCNEIKMKIETRLHAHAEFLRAGSAFFEASDTVTRQQWEEFIKQTKIDKNLRGIQGAGFSLVIPKNQLKQHINTKFGKRVFQATQLNLWEKGKFILLLSILNHFQEETFVPLDMICFPIRSGRKQWNYRAIRI